MENIKISIICQINDNLEYNKQTLESLKNQSFNDYEVIVVNTVDITGYENQIVQTFKDYPQFKYIKVEDPSIKNARNTALELCQGEYIQFIKAGDTLNVEALTEMYPIACNTNADILVSTLRFFNGKTTFINESHLFNGVNSPGFKSIDKNPELFYTLSLTNKLFKASTLKGLFFKQYSVYAKDHLFVLKAYLNAPNIYSVDQIFYNQRIMLSDEVYYKQTVLENGSEVLKDLASNLEQIKEYINTLNIENPMFIKKHYTKRLITMNIKPVSEVMLASRNRRLQIEVIKFINNFLNEIDEAFFNDLYEMQDLILITTLDHYPLLTRKTKLVYERLVRRVFAALDDSNKLRIQANHTFEIYFLRLYNKQNLSMFLYMASYAMIFGGFYLRVSRKIAKNLNDFSLWFERSLKTFYLNTGFNLRKLFKPDEKTIYFYNEELDMNMTAINQYFVSAIEDYQVFYNTPKGYRDHFRTGLRMGHSKFVFVANHDEALYHYKFNKQTRVIKLFQSLNNLQKIGFENEDFKENYNNITDIIVNNEEEIERLSKALKRDEKHFHVLGHPKLDYYFDRENVKNVLEGLKTRHPLLEKQVILFAPSAQDDTYVLPINFNMVCKELADRYTIVVSLNSKIRRVIPSDINQPNYLDLTNKERIQDLILISDIFITDYASLYLEAALVNKRLLFYLNNHNEEEMNLYQSDYDLNLPGTIVADELELIDVIKNNRVRNNKAKAIKEMVFKYQDNNNLKRLLQHLGIEE